MDDEQDGLAWFDRILAEHEVSLAVGTRVRVRLGECRHMGSWHGEIEDDATGMIISTAAWRGAPEGHRFHVWFDRPIRARVAWTYCAAELVPVPPWYDDGIRAGA